MAIQAVNPILRAPALTVWPLVAAVSVATAAAAVMVVETVAVAVAVAAAHSAAEQGQR